jgi:hypothetical protein
VPICILLPELFLHLVEWFLTRWILCGLRRSVALLSSHVSAQAAQPGPSVRLSGVLNEFSSTASVLKRMPWILKFECTYT